MPSDASGMTWRHEPRDLESVAGPVHMDVDPFGLLSLPDSSFLRVNGMGHVISVTTQSPDNTDPDLVFWLQVR